MRDLLYALRNFRRTPLAAVTIVATVALGLGLVTAVFTLLNGLFFHQDAVRNPGELFAVQRSYPASRVQMALTRADLEAIRGETAVFSDVVALHSAIGTRIAGRALNCRLVSGNFFHLLGVHAALGRVLTPEDDESGGRSVIVLSHRGWSRSFAKDPAVVGRTVLINGFRYEIVGVAPDGFRGLSIGAPDYWAPLSRAANFRPRYAGRESEIGITAIGRLRPGVSPEAAETGLTVWASARDTSAAGGVRITLEPRQGTVAHEADEVLPVFAPIFFAFGLILLIACANAANLLLARGIARQREIGIRLSIGASRGRIIRQLLTESLLLAIASAALGLIISRAVLEVSLYATTSTMPAEIAESISIALPRADWRVFVFLVVGAIAATVFFGLAPAIQATRLELVRAMRGEVIKDARPGRARDALIAAQVGASALLLISAAVFLRSALVLSASDIGVRTADTVLVEIATEPLRASVLETLHADPVVARVAASQPHALALPRPAFAETVAPHPGGDPGRRVPVGYRFVSAEFFSVLDIPLLRGRAFANEERTMDSGVVLVSETAARELWPSENPLGKLLRLDVDAGSRTARPSDTIVPSRPFTVVGVVRDVGGSRLRDWPLAGVYLPAGTATLGTTLLLRVRGDAHLARAALFRTLTPIDPALEEIATLRMIAGLEHYVLRLAFWVSVVLGALALVLTLSGLFSVLSYIVEQRTKEIGVRLALGATSGNVMRLVLANLLRQVGLGIIVGAGLAAALASVLVATPAAAWITDLVRVFDPVAYSASIVCIAVACLLAGLLPAQRAARIDPIATLRHDW